MCAVSGVPKSESLIDASTIPFVRFAIASAYRRPTASDARGVERPAPEQRMRALRQHRLLVRLQFGEQKARHRVGV